MNRRQFLAATGTAGLGALSGCSSLASEPTSLGPPTRENPEAGRYYYDFAHGDEHVVNVDVRVSPRAAPDDRITLVLSVGPQADGWESTAIRVALRAPATATPSQSARVLLDVDLGATYPVSFRVTDQGYRVVELDGLAEAGLGNSTIPLEFELVPQTPVEAVALQSTTQWRSDDGSPMEATLTERLSVPSTE
jgi:hypothetical protein